jgi:hypothetical protein
MIRATLAAEVLQSGAPLGHFFGSSMLMMMCAIGRRLMASDVAKA